MNKNPLNMVAPAGVYRVRRRALAASLKDPIVIVAGQGRARNLPTMTHPFRAGSTYLYFGGPPIAGAALWIEPGSDGDVACHLLRPCFDFDEIVWIGDVPADDVLSAASGIDMARFETPDRLTALCEGRTVSHICPPCPRTLTWLGSAGARSAGEDVLSAIISLRITKDEHELDAMRRAADVTVRAHEAAMRATRIGIAEARVTAALYAEYVASGCTPSFTPIVSVRGEILHSETYANQLSENDLLLVDSGAEEPGGYACDVTRTYPCSGRFSSIQRQLHDTVLAAERAAIAACVPGRRYRDVHDVAAKVVCEGLVEADILRGSPDDLVERRAHTLFFTHGVGHLIGLDVHDMEDFGDLAGYPAGRKRRTEFGNCFLRLDRDLEAGMVITIEPGIYLVPAIWSRDELVKPLADAVNRPAVDRLLESGFGGIRIEDTVHVRSATQGGPEVMSAALASDGDDVCAIVNGA